MSQTEWQEENMEFDNLHTLENFNDIYDNQAEMVIYEAISNSIDAGAKNIEIKTFNTKEIFSKEKPITNWEKLNTLDC